MNKARLTQLWHWLSVACVLFLVTSIISLQGGSEFLGRLFADKASVGDNKPGIGYFGAIIGGGLFLMSSSVLLLHADATAISGTPTSQWSGWKGSTRARGRQKSFRSASSQSSSRFPLPESSAAWGRPNQATSASKMPGTSTKAQKRPSYGRPSLRRGNRFAYGGLEPMTSLVCPASNYFPVPRRL
jgi:hypothetical protein